MTRSSPRWLTQQGCEQAKEEVNRLLHTLRSAEHNHNDPAWREQRAWLEARIRHLQELLLTSNIGAPPRDDGIAEPGMVLTVRYDDGDTETFLLASEEAETSEPIELCSPDSPLGRAVLGAKRNETRRLVLPSGAAVSVTVVEAKPFVE